MKDRDIVYIHQGKTTDRQNNDNTKTKSKTLKFIRAPAENAGPCVHFEANPAPDASMHFVSEVPNKTDGFSFSFSTVCLVCPSVVALANTKNTPRPLVNRRLCTTCRPLHTELRLFVLACGVIVLASLRRQGFRGVS